MNRYLNSFVFFVLVFPAFSCLEIEMPSYYSESQQKTEKQKIYLEQFLPSNYSKTGAKSYLSEINYAIIQCSKVSGTLIFPPYKFLVDSPTGIELKSNVELILTGATLLSDINMKNDGQIIYGFNVSNILIDGGVIKGFRENWHSDINVAGINITGQSKNIVIRNLNITNLSSNAVRIYGISDVNTISNVVVEKLISSNCSNIYYDYLEPNPGPIPGSDRIDQGNIAMYYVSNFQVLNCQLLTSKSDGTHFYSSTDGKIENTEISSSKMGGYFLESCKNVFGKNNKISGNGSRGVTIEGNSNNCNLTSSIIENSGREGVWISNSKNIAIYENQVLSNGRKNDGEVKFNIKISDSSWPNDIKNPQTKNVKVFNNLFYTENNQYCVINVVSSSDSVFILNNQLNGPVKVLKPDSFYSGVGRVFMSNNNGWKTESSGIIKLNGALKNQRFLEIEHQLNTFPVAGYDVLKNINITIDTRLVDCQTSGKIKRKFDLQKIYFEFPDSNMILTNKSILTWSAKLSQK